MRDGSTAYLAAISNDTISPRYTLAISFDTAATDTIYITSHEDSPVPVGATVFSEALLWLDGISGKTQSIDPETAASTIGNITVKLMDTDRTLTTHIYNKLTAGDGLRHKQCVFYHAPSPSMNWYDVKDYPEWTLIITDYRYERGKIVLTLSTKNVLARRTVCIPYKDNLAADFAIGATALTVYDHTNFTRVQHGASWTDGPSATVGYVRVMDTGEIFRYSDHETTGEELVVNGDFTLSTGWTFNAGWTANGGTGKADALAASTDLERSITVYSGQTYTVAYTISSYSSGTATIKLGGTAGTARSANGTYTETITAGAGGLVEITGAGFSASVDNVSVKPDSMRLAGLTSARFSTIESAHKTGTETDTKRRTEVVEWIYLELPLVKMILALYTGGIHAPATVFASWPKIPPHWHAGVSINDIDVDSFEDIGIDIWDPADDSKGRKARVDGIEKIDVKTWIEKELLLLGGVALTQNGAGQIQLKRMTPASDNSSPVMIIGEDEQLEPLTIQYDMSRVHTRYQVDWSYDSAIEKTHKRHTIVVDLAAEAKWLTAPVKQLAFRALHGSLDSESALNYQFRTWHGRFSAPPIIARIRCPHIAMGLEVLDIVRLKSITVPDIFTGLDLNRSFQVLGKTTNYATGQVDLDLFGSTGERNDSAQFFTDASVLSDGYYDTSLETYLAANYPSSYTVGGGTLTITAACTLPGGSTYTAYKYTGNVTINDGAIVTLTNNVLIAAKGLLTNNGSFNGKGGGLAGAAASSTTRIKGTAGFVGTAIPTGGINVYSLTSGLVATSNQIQAAQQNSVATTTGKNSTVPYLNLKNNGTTLDGLPTDGRGSSGGNGGRFTYVAVPSPVYYAGGAGGAGGASLILISRGGTMGPSGKIDLSGNPGGLGIKVNLTTIGAAVCAGAGAGGCAGAFYWLMDGANVTVPVLTDNNVISKNAETTKPSGTNVEVAPGTQYKILSNDIVQSSQHGEQVPLAARKSTTLIQYVPKNVTPVTDVLISQVAAPTLGALASGNAELIKLTDGTVVPRIKVTWTASTSRDVKGVRVEWKLSSESNYNTVTGIIPIGTTTAWISDGIKSGVNYDVRIKAINRWNYESSYASQTGYTVLGLTDKPPDCTALTISRLPDGTRRFTPTYASKPADFGGFNYRYVVGTGGTWAGGTAINSLPEMGVPFETFYPEPAVTYTFLVKMVDRTGNESTNAASVEATILDSRVDAHSLIVANWTESANTKNFGLNSVASSGRTVVAVGFLDGTDGYIIRSTDGGATWTEISNAKNISLFSIAVSGTTWVAVGTADGTDAYILRSTDNGVTFSEIANPKNFTLEGVAASGTTWVAVGAADGTDAYVLRSTDDGATFSEISNAKNFGLRCVAASGTTWVAAGFYDGTDAYMLRSTDGGATFSEVSNPNVQALNGIAFYGSTWIAVGYPDGTDAYMIRSTDSGATWSEIDNPINQYLNDIVHTGPMWVAVGGVDAQDNYIISSIDNGDTWIERSGVKRFDLFGLTWTGTRLIAVGSADGTDAYIIRSLEFNQ